MAKTNLQIKAKNAANEASITTTLTYVNPTADSATLKQFAQKLNALTTNNYDEANRVQSINVDTEEVPTKQIATLELVEGATLTRDGTTIYLNLDKIKYNGETLTTDQLSDYTIFGLITTPGNIFFPWRSRVGENYLRVTIDNAQAGNYTINLAIKPLNDYTAATLTETITLT